MQNEDVRCPKVKREKQEKGEWYDLSESEGRGQHIQWADYYKAFSILLVVLAHIYYANHAVKPWIHSFNMPAFFFITGVLLKNKDRMSARELGNYIGRKFRSLMVPYYLWATIYAELTMKNLLRIVYGTHTTLLNSGSLTTLWFLPVLFLCVTAYALCSFLLRKRFTRGVKVILLICCAVIAFFLPEIHRGYPMGLNIAFTAFGFLLLGSLSTPLLDRFQRIVLQHKGGLWICIAAVCLTFAGTLLYKLNEENIPAVLMYDAKYGNMLLFFPAALFGILFTAAIAFLLERISGRQMKKILTYLGKNTFAIFVLNKSIIRCFSYVFARVRVPALVVLIVTCICVVVLCCIANWLLERFAPILIGKISPQIAESSNTKSRFEQ